MSSPFWSFDPFIFNFNFLLFFCFLLLTFPLFTMFFSGLSEKIVFIMKEGMKNLFPFLDFYSMGLLSLLSVFFVISATINLSSLFSYIFSPLAHIMLTILLSMMMWLSSMMYQVLFFLKNKMLHLTPKGTPNWLLVLMVAIEFVSQLIRPITLGVRLAANLTAGHLILTLLASISFTMSFFAQLPLVLLEVVVSMVQPFVFCLLTFLYFIETYDKHFSFTL